MYLGFGSGMAIFLYHGFMKGIPVELEEAAIIDGCSPFGVFLENCIPAAKTDHCYDCNLEQLMDLE
ncbi:hypothetical protein GCM10020331_040020 [Ectobacillus funiculus]